MNVNPISTSSIQKSPHIKTGIPITASNIANTINVTPHAAELSVAKQYMP